MEDCPRHSECVKGKCRCLPGYKLLEPLNRCFEGNYHFVLSAFTTELMMMMMKEA